MATVSQTAAAVAETTTNGKDYFVERNGLRYAGTHLLIDLWKAKGLDNLALVEQALREAVTAAGATLLNIHLHHFSPNGGISGVAVLAESHISIHTWPEREFAAIDIFMCGSCDPYKAVPVLRRMLETDSIQLNEQRRGLMP
jgi:S-adenosylmethionine decarboxylase